MGQALRRVPGQIPAFRRSELGSLQPSRSRNASHNERRLHNKSLAKPRDGEESRPGRGDLQARHGSEKEAQVSQEQLQYRLIEDHSISNLKENFTFTGVRRRVTYNLSRFISMYIR